MNPETVKKAIYYFFGAWLAISAALPYAVYNLSNFIEENNTPVAEASSHNMMLFWDGGSAPSGWTIVSDDLGEDFTNVMPRGADTYGGTGGSDNHTHTVTHQNETGPSSTVTPDSGSAASASPDNHTHDSFSSSSTSSESVLPDYRSLEVIKYTNSTGEPSTIPSGAIAIFESTSDFDTNNWTRYSAQDNKYIRTEPSSGNDGGSNSHSHNVNFTLSDDNTSVGIANAGRTPVTGATPGHDHSGSGTNSSENHEPTHIEIILAKADSNISIPTDMIAMWDGSPPSNWTKNSGTNGDFNGNFFKAVSSTTFPTTGGSSAHRPEAQVITSGGPSSTGSVACSGCSFTVASDTHTHDVTVSYSQENNLPSYLDVITAKRTSGGGCNLGVTAPSDISQPTGNPGDTTDYDWGSGELVTVTEGGSGWTLTVTSTDLTDGSGNSIPQANVKLSTDGTLSTFDTKITNATSNVTETTAGDYPLDDTQTVSRRTSGTSCDETDHQLTTKVDIPVDTSATSTYTGTLTLTVS